MKLWYVQEELQLETLRPQSELKMEAVSLEQLSKGGADVLFVAATDESADVAKAAGVPVLGYLGKEEAGPSFSGVSMLVMDLTEFDDEFFVKVWQRANHLPWTIAVTPRTTIREIALSDLEDLERLYAKPHMTDFVEPLFAHEEELEYQRAYIENMYRFYGYGMWVVFDRESGELIGRAGIEHREYDGEVQMELGYMIAPEYQHKGYATEVCQAILSYAKEEHDINEITSLVDPRNEASNALMRRLGFFSVGETDVTGERLTKWKKSEL